jgi:hypothetical protein
MTEKWGIENQILQCEIKLNDKVNMKLTEEEKMLHSNVWHTHRELTDGIKKSHGKIYSLLLGQFTQVLIDKLKQDADWGQSLNCLTPSPSSSWLRTMANTTEQNNLEN